MVVILLPPRLYLDTCVFLDLIEGRNSDTIALIKKAQQNKWIYVISAFTGMEAVDIKQEHKFFYNKVEEGIPLKRILSNRQDRDLNEPDINSVNNALEKKSKIWGLDKVTYLGDKDHWLIALNITRETNINSSDAIHLATALGLGVDILVTNDNGFISNAEIYLAKNSIKNLKVCLPEHVEHNLASMGLIKSETQ